MARTARPFVFPLLLARLFLSVSAQTASVSISRYSAYLNQVGCVKDCVWLDATLDDLIAKVGCSSPWVNGCFCRPEAASSAASFLSSCVSSRCSTLESTSLAVTSAVLVYNGYCSDNGYSIPTVASIKSYSAYESQPGCVKRCLWSPDQSSNVNSNNFAAAVDCQAFPWENACVCSSAKADSARAFLTTCVASNCGVATDASQVTAAVSVHADYCSSAGIALPAITGDTRITNTASRADLTSGPLPTGDPGDQTHNSGTGLSTRAIAGIAVGSVAAAAVLIAAVIFILYKRRRQSPSMSETLPSTASPRAAYMYHGGPVQPRHGPPQGIYEKPSDRYVAEADSNAQPVRYEMHG